MPCRKSQFGSLFSIDAFRLGNILTDSISDILHAPVIAPMRSLLGTAACPMLLCKPSAINQVFKQIEDARRNDGRLPRDMSEWLDAMIEHNERFGDTDAFVPSVSGIYEEYVPPNGDMPEHGQ